MEENKKPIHWKLNLFDLLVLIVAVVAVAAVVFLRYQQQQRQQQAQDAAAQSGVVTVRYTIELTEMPLQAAQLIQPGDALTERTRKESLGTVESVDVALSRTLTKDQTTGNYYFTEIPERYTATIVVTSSASDSDRAIVTEGSMEIRAGTSIRVYGPGYYGTGYIISVDRG